MTRRQWKARLLYAFQYVPFTWNTVIAGIVFWASWSLLHRPEPEKDTPNDALDPFIRALGEFVLWFVLILVSLSVVSTLLTWLYFLLLHRRKESKLEVAFTIERPGPEQKKKLFIEVALPRVIRPMLGFVKGRLLYDTDHMTAKFGLLSARREKRSMLRNAIAGRSRVTLPDIREYHINGGFVYYEDMLQLISLPVKQAVSSNFYQPPVDLGETIDHIAPKKTETMDVRIDQLRKVEGEYLNYKDFESGDDVRRIVWKLYAKNRDLVVRMPERMEPYASHLYFYASFYNSLGREALFEGYFSEMLNFYKNNVWAIYRELQRKEWQVRYIPDQQFNLPEQADELQRTERIISNSRWQQDKSTRDYFDARSGTVLVISSLTDPEELARMLEETDPSVQIYYVKLSVVFRHLVALSWLKRLFFLPPKDRLSRLKNNWTFSSLRPLIRKREKELEALLEKM